MKARLFAACALGALALCAPLSLKAGTDAGAAAATAPVAASTEPGAPVRCDPRPWLLAGETCLQPVSEDGAIRVVRVVTLSRFVR